MTSARQDSLQRSTELVFYMTIVRVDEWQNLDNSANHSSVVIQWAGLAARMGDSLIGTRHSGSFELKTAQIGRAPTSNDIRSGTETAWDRSGPSRWAGGTCRTGARIHNGWMDLLNVGGLAWKTCANDLSIPRRWTDDPMQACPTTLVTASPYTTLAVLLYGI